MSQCVRCGSQLGDGAYVCVADAQTLAEALLAAAGHAEDASTLGARGARYSTGGHGGGDTPLPDLTRSVKLGAVRTSVRFWVEDLTGGRPRLPWRRLAGPACGTGVRCRHSSCAAVRDVNPPSPLAQDLQWLSGQVGVLRKHPAAGEVFRDLHAACAQLARLVDVAPAKDLVGMCDCGKTLYARHGQAFVTCPQVTCKLIWHVERSREILRRALDDKLVSAAEAARLAQYLDGDRTQDQIRKLVTAWARRGQIVAHSELGDEPAYRFGDVADRLARTPRRERTAA